MIYNVMISKQAESDLREIYQYIADVLLSPENAEKQINRLETAIMKLQQFPKRYKVYQEEPWHSREMRVMPVDKFLIFYISNDSDSIVTILRVMYSRRDITMNF